MTYRCHGNFSQILSIATVILSVAKDHSPLHIYYNLLIEEIIEDGMTHRCHGNFSQILSTAVVILSAAKDHSPLHITIIVLIEENNRGWDDLSLSWKF